MTSLLNELGAAASRAGAFMLMQTVALAAALLVVELITGRRLRATLRCALWLLVVAKLLLPPDFALPTGVAYWVGPWLVSPVRASDPLVASVSVSAVDVGIPVVDLPHEPAAILATTAQPRLGVSAGLGLAWLGGTAVMLGVILRRNREVSRLVRDSDPASPAHQQALQEAAGRIGLRRLPELRMTRHEHSPAVCGLLRSTVLLPRSLASALSPAALQDVLLHELIHVHRRDLWMNLPQTLALILWWWNPVIWLAHARIRSLREQAVDERVMVVREGDPGSYPATLLEVARHCAARPTLALSFVGILESNGALRSRVERLLGSPVPRRAHLGTGGWIAVILAALLFLPMAFARRVEPVVPATSNPPPLKREAVYVMDPELARRYGLVPATNASPGEPMTNFYRMDPVLARRYGLIPPEAKPAKAPAETNAPPVTEPGAGLVSRFPDSGLAGLSLGRRLIMTKLSGIVLPRFALEGDSLLDAVGTLTKQVQALDPEGHGVNFTIADPGLHGLSFRSMTPLTNIRLVDALEAMVRLANQPLQCEVRENAVAFSTPPPAASELYTRSYRVSPNTFVNGLQAVTGITLAPDAGPAEIMPLVKDFFRACGVEFPTSIPASSVGGEAADPNAMQRAIYYNDRTGVLFVRATLRDLDVIEKAIEALNVAPPQVQLEVRFVEVDPAASLQIESDQLSLNTESQTLTAVLTPSQFDRMIQGLEAHPGTKVLATPKVSTLSGRAAQISMVQETPSVNRRTGDTQKLPIGPVLDVTPQVLVEPPTIRLTLAAQLHQVTDEPDADTGVPQVLTHEFAATVPALDGHTVVLFADASGRDLASASAKRARRILVFVTPVLVDPAGNRVNPPGK